MPSAPFGIDLGDPLSQVLAAVVASDPQDQLSQDFINKLISYYGGLASQQQQALIQNLQQHTGSVRDFTTYLQNNTQVTGGSSTTAITPAGQKKSTPSPPASNSPAGQQSQQVTAATTNLGQLSEKTLSGTPVPGSAGSGQQGYNEILDQFTQSQFDATNGNIAALAEQAGTDPQTLQQQYASYRQGWATASQSFRRGYVGGVGDDQAMSLTQFAQQQAQTLQGSWAPVISLINNVYRGQTGTDMPGDLMRQVLTALNSMPTNQQSVVLYNAYLYMQNYQQGTTNKALIDQAGSYQASVLSALPSSILTYSAGSAPGTGSFGTAGLLGAYMQLHPTASLQQSQTAAMISSAFESALGRGPTPAELSALGSDPSPGQVTDYLNNLPMPGYPGMTYGQYTTAHHNLDALWQSSFGRLPSQQELLWAVGKSSAQLSDFVDNSPSSIPGVTMGRYNDLTNWIKSTSTSGVTTHAFSAGVDDSLVQSLHNQLQSASTGHAQPGPLSP